MENLQIEGTRNSPQVQFSTTGNFKMHGRILTENAVNTFEPIITWIRKYEGNAIEFEIELDYMNTSASMQLFSLLRILDEKYTIPEISVKWYYEEDDEDHLETGEFYEDKLDRIKFQYYVAPDKDFN